MAVIDSLFSAELCSNQSCKDISTGVKDNLELRTSITTAEMYGDKVPQPIYSDIPFVETLNKVHISVKSTEKYHLSRVSILLLTWFQTVPPKNVSPLAFSESSLYNYNYY